MRELYVVAGLGNPGDKYKKTRHNVGFDTIDLLSSHYKIDVNKLRHKGLVGEGFIDDKKIVLVKPQTYMNLSGECIVDVVQWYKIELTRLILVYDDVDIPLGDIRIRIKGSAGTHNGVKSVIRHLNSDDFPRVRIGIGKPNEEHNLINYVTQDFSKADKEIVDKSIEKAGQAIVTIISEGINAAMNKYN